MAPAHYKTTAAQWRVYMLQTANGALYTGITTDPERRLREHESGRAGARSLRGRGPLRLVYTLPAADRSQASRIEARIKKLTRAQKLQLIEQGKIGVGVEFPVNRLNQQH